MEGYNMNWKGFFAKIISAVMWPTVILIIVMCFRGLISKKVGQLSSVATGLFSAEFAMEAERKLAALEFKGIDSEDDLKDLEVMADYSGRVARYLKESGREGAELELAKATFDKTTKVLKDVEDVRKMSKAGIDAKRLGKVKADLQTLKELGIDPDVIKAEDGVERVAALVERKMGGREVAVNERRIRALIDEENLRRLKNDVERLDEIKVDPRQIRVKSVKPEVIEEYVVDVSQFEKYRKPWEQTRRPAR